MNDKTHIHNSIIYHFLKTSLLLETRFFMCTLDKAHVRPLVVGGRQGCGVVVPRPSQILRSGVLMFGRE